MTVVIALNLLGAIDATLPGRTFRRAAPRDGGQIEHDGAAARRAEITLAFWLERMYLDPTSSRRRSCGRPTSTVATEVERWLRESGAWLAHRDAARHRPRQLRALRRPQPGLRLGAVRATARRSLGTRRRVREPRVSPAPGDRAPLAPRARSERASVPLEHDDPPPAQLTSPAERMAAGMDRLGHAEQSCGARLLTRAADDEQRSPGRGRGVLLCGDVLPPGALERRPARVQAAGSNAFRTENGSRRRTLAHRHRGRPPWRASVAPAPASCRSSGASRRIRPRVTNARFELRRVGRRAAAASLMELWDRWVHGEVS